MKVLIIEDEEHAANRLQKLLTEEIPDIQIEGPLDTVKKAIQHLEKNQDYDLLFLDIQLADGKSFSIFERIKLNIPIIFTTAFDEYAIKAFDLNSIDYLLKPIQRAKLKISLKKFRKLEDYYGKSPELSQISEILSALKQTSEVPYQSRFLLSKGDSLLPVGISEIAYFYAEDKVVFVVLNDQSRIIFNSSLDEIEKKVDPKLFFRVNRQFLISVKAIKKVHFYFNYKLKLELNPVSEEEVIVSRLRAADFKAWMNG
ncbi:MAG: response regulator transcription factor [Bacteroidetes bacterium]|nr:response regulator transcription factor [Bacteroidota bacterium]